MSDGLDQWCAFAAAHGLRERRSMTLDTDEATALVHHADEARVLGLVAASVAAGAIVMPDDARAHLEAEHVKALHRCLLAEEAAVVAAEALAGAGVDVRVLKGIAVAHLDEGDPAMRHFADADLLIRRDDHATALAALAAAGFWRDEPPVHEWWEQRYGKAVTFLAPNGAELDLHLSFVGGWYGVNADLATLWRTPPDTFALAGATMDGVPRAMRLVHAAYHAVLGGGSGVRALRDVALLATGHPLDWLAARTWAGRSRGDAVLAEAVRLAWWELRLDPSHPAVLWAEGFRQDAADRRHLAAYRRERGSEWGPEGRSAVGAMGWRDRTMYVAGAAFPSRESLRHRGRTLPQHLRRLARVARPESS